MRKIAGLAAVVFLALGVASAQEVYIPNYNPRIPEHVLYGFVFHQAAAFAARARAAQLKGGHGQRWVRAMAHELGLSLADTQTLMRDATAFQLEEDVLSQHYAPVVAAFRKKYFPHGRALSQARPPAPPELQAFEAGRVGLIRKYRSLIAGQLGPAKFAALDAKVRRRVEPDVHVYRETPAPAGGAQ